MLIRNPDGRTTFRSHHPHAASVELIGAFTDWTRGSVTMEREPDGWWHVSLELPPGEHSFCYLVDHALWLADYQAHGVMLSKDGKWLSLIRVEQAGVASGTPAASGPRSTTAQQTSQPVTQPVGAMVEPRVPRPMVRSGAGAGAGSSRSESLTSAGPSAPARSA